MNTKLLQSCPTLCNSMDCSPPGSSVRGILQAGILEWASMLSSSGLEPTSPVSSSAGGFFTTEPPVGPNE